MRPGNTVDVKPVKKSINLYYIKSLRDIEKQIARTKKMSFQGNGINVKNTNVLLYMFLRVSVLVGVAM